MIPRCARVRGPIWRVVYATAATTALVAASSFVAAVPLVAQSVRQVARSPYGMVVTAQPLATLAGRQVLELGGNAADAAVAAGFAIAVVEPSMNGIGGRNQILIRTPVGDVYGIDGTTQVPGGYDPDTAPSASHGYATIGVPGAVAGLLRLHAEYGSLPLPQIMGPAIDYAESGFRLTPGEAERQAGARGALGESEGGRAYFLRADRGSYRAGERLVQADLAQTLRRIAAGGAEEFYTGSIAERIAADMEANGGFLTRSSLAAYEAVSARVVRGTYRGYEIVGLDVPASGAIAIQALHIAEHFDAERLGPEAWAAVLGQAVGLAALDRSTLGTDSAAARVTSREWAAHKAQRIHLGTPAAGVGALGPETPASTDWLARDGHTTHLSTADADGMMVALTQTIGPDMGSRIATPGLGFLYAVTLGGYLGRVEPGERVRSSITPLFVEIDGRPVVILGAAGGGRIISAVVQAVSRIVDDGMTLPEALAAPRVHPGSSGPGMARVSRLSIEAAPGDGWSDAELEVFQGLGFDVEPSRRRGAFGRIHAIAYDAAAGTWIGVADPDWEGSAEGATRSP
jgi:gamma-glutamyltranspeptidase/glutathione hydrolase